MSAFASHPNSYIFLVPTVLKCNISVVYFGKICCRYTSYARESVIFSDILVMYACGCHVWLHMSSIVKGEHSFWVANINKFLIKESSLVKRKASTLKAVNTFFVCIPCNERFMYCLVKQVFKNSLDSHTSEIFFVWACYRISSCHGKTLQCRRGMYVIYDAL